MLAASHEPPALPMGVDERRAGRWVVSKIGRVWLVAVLALGGAGLVPLQPVAGVAVGVVGAVLSTFMAIALNVPLSRHAQRVAAVGAAAAVYLATESPLLAAATAVPFVVLMPNEPVMSTSAALVVPQLLFGSLSGAVLVAAAWPTGLWGLAAVPGILLNAMFLKGNLDGRKHANVVLKNTKLRVGERLPDIRLPYRDGDGEFVLADERGGALLLVFVRGDWCPMCHVMMRLISREAKTLARHAVKLVIITPTEGPVDGEFAQQLGLETRLVLDKGSATALSFSMQDAGERDGQPIPLPVALLVDRDGVLRDVTRPDDVSRFAGEKKIIESLARALPAAA